MLKRIKNKHLRYTARAFVAVICICAVWFASNRALSGQGAIELRTLEAEETSEGAFAGRLRIGTYNIAHGRGTAKSNWQIGKMKAHLERLKQIARLLREERLDIVVLNEVDFDTVWSGHMNQAEYIAREAGFPFLVEQRNYDAALPFVSLRWGNAILSRYPIRDAQLVGFPGYAAWEAVVAGHKQGLLCTVALADALSIRVLAVHLEHRSETVRTEAARKIENIRKASSLPLVVAGDLNSTPLSFPHAQPDGDGQTAMSYLLDSDAYRTLPAGAPGHADLTFSSMQPRAVIDWILLPLDWEILSKTVTGGDLSDHKAVIMEVAVDGGSAWTKQNDARVAPSVVPH